MTSSPSRDEIAIATTIDDAWAPHFATCAASIAASRGPESIRFILLKGPSLSTGVIARAREFVRELGMELEAVRVPEDMLRSLPATLLFSPLVWYRLLLPELLPSLDRVIALDSDTLVMQSLMPLQRRELDGSLIAAVSQPVTGSEGRLSAIGLDPKKAYFNAGVMLMDLAGMRNENVSERAIQLGHDRIDQFIFAEQDALNVLLAQQWKRLAPGWNALSYLWLLPGDADGTYSQLELDAARLSPAIVHFEGFQTVKPWYYRSVHPLRHLYRDFRAQTPWPLTHLERRSLAGALLRPLPLRWQYGITRGKARVSTRIETRRRR